MEGICSGMPSDLTLDDGCKIKRMPAFDFDRHKRRLVRVGVLDDERFFQPTVHYDCPENQLRALVNRVAGVVPKPTGEGLIELRVAAARIGRLLPPTVANPLDEMPLRYSGAKRQRYTDALGELYHFGLSKYDASVKMFVKPERFDGGAKVNPDPRAIQFRASKYCVALAAFLHPIEHFIYLFKWASAGVTHTRNVAKGLNSVDRAELFLVKWAQFQSPVALGLDASRFDKHVSRALLIIEHSVYLTSNPDSEFRRLLSWQLVNHCYSNLGLAYKVDGRRMSGDMNTAAGNCLLMLIMLLACLTALMITKWDCLDDGDDVIVIVEERDLAAFQSGVRAKFLSYGMNMKVEEPVRCPYQVEFCQSKIVEYVPGKHKFVRNYKAVVSKALCGVRHWTDIVYRQRVLQAIGMCELVLGLGVPVLQSFACAVIRNCGISGGFDFKYAPEGLASRTQRDLRLLGLEVHQVRPQRIRRCARETFALAFGLQEGEQLDLERRFDAWTFDSASTSYEGAEWDVDSWTPVYARGEVYRQ